MVLRPSMTLLGGSQVPFASSFQVHLDPMRHLVTVTQVELGHRITALRSIHPHFNHTYFVFCFCFSLPAYPNSQTLQAFCPINILSFFFADGPTNFWHTQPN